MLELHSAVAPNHGVAINTASGSSKLPCADALGAVNRSDNGIVTRKVFLKCLHRLKGMQHIQDRFAPGDFGGVLYLPNIEKLAPEAVR